MHISGWQNIPLLMRGKIKFIIEELRIRRYSQHSIISWEREREKSTHAFLVNLHKWTLDNIHWTHSWPSLDHASLSYMLEFPWQDYHISHIGRMVFKDILWEIEEQKKVTKTSVNMLDWLWWNMITSSVVRLGLISLRSIRVRIPFNTHREVMHDCAWRYVHHTIGNRLEIMRCHNHSHGKTLELWRALQSTIQYNIYVCDKWGICLWPIFQLAVTCSTSTRALPTMFTCCHQLIWLWKDLTAHNSWFVQHFKVLDMTPLIFILALISLHNSVITHEVPLHESVFWEV